MYKKYGIDIDGVLANFDQAMIKVMRKLGINLPDDFHPSDWNWGNANLPSDGMARAWAIIDATENFWESLTPTEDILTMATFFHEHADNDCDIYFITAREDSAGRSVRKQSENWLREYLGHPKQTINVLPSKSGMDKVDILHAMHVDCSIDDHTPTIVNAKTLKPNHRAYLLNKPWNQDGKFYSLKIVNSLKEFFEKEPV
jgi:hypothetical protein